MMTKAGDHSRFPASLQGEVEIPKVRCCINREAWDEARQLFGELFGLCICKRDNCCE